MKLELVGSRAVIEAAGIDGGVTDPDITTLTNGNILVSWTEYLSQPTDLFDDTDGAVFAQVLDSDGTAISEIIQINDYTPHDQHGPQVVAIAGGGFGISWTNTATYGDDPADSDIFMKFFFADGSEIENLFLDVQEDSPGTDLVTDVVQEIVPLSEDRFAMVRSQADSEGASAYIFDSGATVTFGLSGSIDDVAQLANGNIVVAGVENAAANYDRIRLEMFSDRFRAPDDIDGVYSSLKFYINGTRDTLKAADNLELAALGGGGFALAYVEQVDEDKSTIRLAILSDEALKQSDRPELTRDYSFDSEKAEFDMIGLSGGGLAMAVSRPDTGATGTGVDILLFDANGELKTTLMASTSDAGDQANPALTELADGRIALAYTDLSDTGTAGAATPLRLAFFEVTGGTAKLFGTAGDDVLAGVGGNDRILGGDGDDTIRGRNGNDRLFGEDGNDRLLGGNGKDALRGGGGNDTLLGGSGHDGLGGGAGRDRLEGGAGRDILGGGAGNDRLIGGAGDDWLKGGAGNDLMKGGGGSDTFHFVRGRSGTDTVQDFDAAEDILSINLRGGKAAQVEVEASGGDTVVSFGSASVTLQDVTLAKADIDFLFS